MRITHITPSLTPPFLARFDVEISEHLSLNDLNLRRLPSGRLQVYAKATDGRRPAHISHELSTEFARLALDALEAEGLPVQEAA